MLEIVKLSLINLSDDQDKLMKPQTLNGYMSLHNQREYLMTVKDRFLRIEGCIRNQGISKNLEGGL